MPESQLAPDQSRPTNISVSSRIIQTNVKRFGINLSGQSFYDSGIMLRDLAFRNPGFEGTIWQTVLQCKVVKGDACTDNYEWSLWPADFAKGAAFEFFYGAARGQTGAVTGNTTASSSTHQGMWLNFSKMTIHPQVGDFYIIRKKMPGTAEGGWWSDLKGGATLATEFHDIPIDSIGKQSLRINASGPEQSASVTSGIDTWEKRSFLQLKGEYTLSFRAKAVLGNNHLSASVTRQSEKYGNLTYLAHDVQLSSTWQQFQFKFTAKENGSFIGPILVNFSIHGGTVLLDDASFVESANPDNRTEFRNAVVDRLRELRPGILRYMDNGANYGSTIDNLIAPVFARQRAGYSETIKDPGDTPIGLHEFLVLCQAVNADPWFAMPVGLTPSEMRNLIEYLAGPSNTNYGAKRAALGQSAPWTAVFPVIHLELGNEAWNAGSFPGESIPDPKAYGTRASEIFAAARSAPHYSPAKFDLIMDGWSDVPWSNEQALSVHPHADTFDIAPYTFNSLNNFDSDESVFGPMFAEPESLDSRPTGNVARNAALAAKYDVKLAVYEVNLSTVQGKAPQEALESTIPSIGAGLSVVDHMLLMLRDDGILNQAVFSLPEYVNGFHNTDIPEQRETVKLWGTVVDMGGQTNRVRPTFLAEELANSAIADNMIEVVASGDNPTWDQASNGNGGIKLTGAHFLQSFAFTDGKRCNLVLFNLSRTRSLPITLSGDAIPPSSDLPVVASQLTSSKITDNNESAQTVNINQQTLPHFNPSTPYPLPPFSMTVLSWDVSAVQFHEAAKAKRFADSSRSPAVEKTHP